MLFMPSSLPRSTASLIPIFVAVDLGSATLGPANVAEIIGQLVDVDVDSVNRRHGLGESRSMRSRYVSRLRQISAPAISWRDREDA